MVGFNLMKETLLSFTPLSLASVTWLAWNLGQVAPKNQDGSGWHHPMEIY